MKPEDKDEKNLYNPNDSEDDSGNEPAKTHKRDSAISWTASEYIEHQRGATWYVLLVMITVSLAVGIYFVTKDYFATGTIVILGIIVAVFAGRKPNQIKFELSQDGLRAGEKSYGYNLFKSFSIIKEGNLSSISLMPIKRFMPPVSAYFEPKDEQKITALIGEYLPYEERKPGAVDRLSFRLRL